MRQLYRRHTPTSRLPVFHGRAWGERSKAAYPIWTDGIGCVHAGPYDARNQGWTKFKLIPFALHKRKNARSERNLTDIPTARTCAADHADTAASGPFDQRVEIGRPIEGVDVMGQVFGLPMALFGNPKPGWLNS